MKILIFLDIDGVLKLNWNSKNWNSKKWNSGCVSCLNELVSKYDNCEIVNMILLFHLLNVIWLKV